MLNKKDNDMKSIKRELKLATENSSFGYYEAFKSLRTNLEYMMDKRANKTKASVIMVTSSIPGEGKTNISINLAYSIAQSNKKVLLIDCDLRAGRIYRYLKISPGVYDISDILDKKVSPEESVLFLDKLGFSVIISAGITDRPSELLSNDNMKRILQHFSEGYDYIILDIPPVNAVSDSLIISKYIDGALLVVSHNSVTRDVALHAKEELEKVGAPILGVVLNKYDAKKGDMAHAKEYSYYGSYGKYGYGNK